MHVKWERAHEGLTCDQFAQWKHDNDPQLQQQGLAAHLEENDVGEGPRCYRLEMIDGSSVSECPACHFCYDLAREGCMHFKCTQCPKDDREDEYKEKLIKVRVWSSSSLYVVVH